MDNSEHKTWLIVAMYLMVFVSLLLSVVCKCLWTTNGIGYDWIIGICLVIFLHYDILFRQYHKDNWLIIGRSIETTLDSIRAACQYISYFIAFIAISFTLFSEMKIPNSKETFDLIIESPILRIYIFLVLSFSAISLLFIPIPYATVKSKDEPSKALKNCFTAVVFMEKVIVTLTIYFVLLFLVMKYKGID